ncbi:SDR family NAD(P)-dependent oxidoreductase [Cryptosporangium phraense]|uniref:SDR family oxidoreductase n=1 Tax=Cryptosporangium phraense TaxID=2593070 RepID=A0A545AQ91_9ACTN|nr:SDR family oxidoreductase [Cryptosporangium phraense]TQS43450.1 SDR family oxidoreductase [Cryptosporangium phraense]
MTSYLDLFRLDGRRALVVGAASGIGLEAAQALEDHGAAVTRADQHASDGVEKFDVLDADAVVELARRPFDVLVFTPATNVRKRLTDYTDADFDRVVGLNLRASFQLIRHFGAAMAAAGGGSIVCFSSIRAATVEPGQGVYAATKSGLESLVRTAAAEFGPAGVRVNAIRPGVVATPLTDQLRADPDWAGAYAAKTALGRWSTPDELAGAVVYLAGRASTYVTGSVLTVDGGWTAQDGRYDPPN